MSVKIEFRKITKTFPGIKALNEVSFQVLKGEFHAIVGENGAGKSTLIKIVSGALTPDYGEMLLDGRIFKPSNPREAISAGIATIYQERIYLPERNAIFNIMLGCEPRKSLLNLDLNKMKKQCQALLKMLHSETIPLSAKAKDLKAGQKQILEIARALNQKSSILIMDEPSSALNQEEQNALFKLINELKSQGLTIIYVSHRLEEIFKMADRVTVLRDGRHIRTVAIRDTNKDEIINDMIGRRWSSAFPPKNLELKEPVLEVENLCSNAFRKISFHLRAGEVLGITGLAGSGKEELARALFCAYPLDKGSIRVSGREVKLTTLSALDAGIAYLPEDRKNEGIISALPVRRNISLPVIRKLADSLGRIIRNREAELAKDWVSRLGIKTQSIEQLCESLSGGNQQKVVLARCLATGAKVIILASPTQEVDVVAKFELYQFISELSAKGVGIILISSDIPELIGVCHNILVMRDGEIIARLKAEGVDGESILRYALGLNQRVAL